MRRAVIPRLGATILRCVEPLRRWAVNPRAWRSFDGCTTRGEEEREVADEMREWLGSVMEEVGGMSGWDGVPKRGWIGREGEVGGGGGGEGKGGGWMEGGGEGGGGRQEGGGTGPPPILPPPPPPPHRRSAVRSTNGSGSGRWRCWDGGGGDVGSSGRGGGGGRQQVQHAWLWQAGRPAVPHVQGAGPAWRLVLQQGACCVIICGGL